MAAGIPENLKSIGHYIKIANEHANRDPIIYYWCLLYGVQTGMAIDKKSPDCLQYLTQLLATLEQVKKQLAGNEGISQELVAQARIEQVAIKLFNYADSEDRASRHGKNVVKAFYTAGHLMDVLTLFNNGELDEQIAANRKYAKWKATYIHNCLKNGQTPVPGPIEGDQDTFEGTGEPHGSHLAGETSANEDIATVGEKSSPFIDESGPSFPKQESADSAVAEPKINDSDITADQLSKAQKYAKYAISAMTYEDTPTAIENLQKALKLLTTGVE